ncbi:hypothetical protein C0J52_14786 [Blattella germanica]|nr:hypothetical protein C0J52_14786 [Blattella germanica]
MKRTMMAANKWCLILLSIFMIKLCDETEGMQLFHRGRGKGGLLKEPYVHHDVPLPPDEWFEQQLDHFNPTDLRTWKQRYFTNASFHVPGGPVFLMIGGEAAASAKWMVEGQWINYAQKYNALCFQLEHRYYGESHPTRNLGTKNLAYLSSEQALADLAYFIEGISVKYELPLGTKWIAFGGSYPGSLAAWLRLKYPHLVYGSVSASGPLLAKADFRGVAQYNRDNRKSGSNITLDVVCDVMTNESIGTPVHRYAAVNEMLLNDGEENCLDYKYNKMINVLEQIDWQCEAAEGGRQWTYQTCTEFGFFQTSSVSSDLFGNEFPVDFFIQQCSDIFGKRYNKDQLAKGIKRTNIMYGALKLKASRVIYVHGSVDPWHALGITKTIRKDSPAIYINGTAHCANISMISNRDWCFALFIICIIYFCGKSEGRRIYYRGRRYNGFVGTPKIPANTTVPKDEWFEQRLDHFNPTDAKMWQQRYFTNASFHVPGGPVFLLIGGEAEASPDWMVQGQWIIYAQKSLTAKSLQYLTSQQSLADLAYFIKKITIKYELPPGTKIVKDDLSISNKSCVATIQEANRHLHTLMKTPMGQDTVNEIFQLCDPIDILEENDVANLYGSLAFLLSGVAQYMLANESIGTPVHRYAAMIDMILSSEGEECLDYKYDNMITEMSQVDWESEEVTTGGTSHCADMYEPSANDPQSLMNARKMIDDLIGLWLDED